jgi:hypothetical protein
MPQRAESPSEGMVSSEGMASSEADASMNKHGRRPSFETADGSNPSSPAAVRPAAFRKRRISDFESLSKELIERISSGLDSSAKPTGAAALEAAYQAAQHQNEPCSLQTVCNRSRACTRALGLSSRTACATHTNRLSAWCDVYTPTIHPDSTRAYRLAVFFALTSVYVSVLIPVEIAFDDTFAPDEWPLLPLNVFVDVLCLLRLLVKLNTGVYDQVRGDGACGWHFSYTPTPPRTATAATSIIPHHTGVLYRLPFAHHSPQSRHEAITARTRTRRLRTRCAQGVYYAQHAAVWRMQTKNKPALVLDVLAGFPFTSAALACPPHSLHRRLVQMLRVLFALIPAARALGATFLAT